MILTAEDIKPYVNGKKKHPAYELTTSIYDALRIHANGEKPDKLLNDYRPSETAEIRKYRLSIYEPVTKEHFSQIITSLNKIRRSSDWSIKYCNEDIPSKISDSETPEKYYEENFPFFSSVTNWAFSVLLKNYLMDPNAVCLVMPLKMEVEANEYKKPYPIIFNSDQVYQYVEGECAILLSKEKASYKSGNSTRHDGQVFYVVDEQKIYRYEQRAREYELVWEEDHNMAKMPAFKLKGRFFQSMDTYMVYESRISSIVPRLNKVIREDSDLDAAKVTHLYPEAWEYATQPCDKCYDATAGMCTGKVKEKNKLIACDKCHGTCVIATSGPYKKLIVRPINKNLGETEMPTPPKGYISKPLEIVKLQDEIIDKNSYKALASIQMQFLLQTPLNQSGYAKDVDRDELNTFVHSVAEDIIYIMDLVYAIGNDWRYFITVPIETEREKLSPEITVPEKYDLLSLAYMMDEIVKAVEKKISPAILQPMLIEFVNKKFYNQKEIKDMLVTSLKLDPIPCTGEDEKVLRKQNGGVTEVDYIISCNIVTFIQRAVEEDKSFYDKKLAEQMEVMKKYAGEVKNENNGKTAIVKAIDPATAA